MDKIKSRIEITFYIIGSIFIATIAVVALCQSVDNYYENKHSGEYTKGYSKGEENTRRSFYKCLNKFTKIECLNGVGNYYDE